MTKQGDVSCWGMNTQAPPVVGPMRHSGVPVPVVGLPGHAASVAPGTYGTCTVTSGSDVYCWGNGGAPSTPATPLAALPTGVSMLSQGGNACAVTTSGSVVCDLSAPAVVPGLETGIAMVSVGGSHQCALTTAGAVLCWGWNDSGQLGHGGTEFYSAVPVGASGLSSGVRSLVAGSQHTCAVTSAGGAVCWGSDMFGQLGDGPENEWQSNLPVAVAGLASGVASVSAGVFHSCALLASGGVRCWGHGEYGQLGGGEVKVSYDAPVAVVGLDAPVTRLSAGNYHTCAVTNGGAVRCWGNNDAGQLGVGSTPHSGAPVGVADLSSIVKVFAESNRACAVNAGGNAWCWGEHPQGQALWTVSSVPLPPEVGSSGIATISGDCAMTTGGGLFCWKNWGLSPPTTVIGEPVLPSGVSAISGGCILSTAGAVSCFDTSGEFEPYTLFPVTGLASGVTKLATDSSHGCVVKLSGAWCWGENGDGQLGDGTTTDRTLPAVVSGLASGVAAIEVGWAHTCALTTLGGVLCWGENNQGQLGDGTTVQRTLPVPVSGLASGVVAISAGNHHTCALRGDGSVLCWGDNLGGQLGDASFEDRLTPAAVTGLEADAVSIATGYRHTCAARATGSVYCWGDNSLGQLGGGSIVRSGVPLPVVGFEAAPPAVPALGAPGLLLLGVSLLGIGGALLERRRAHRR